MHSDERNYIGNGKQKPGSGYIVLNLCLEDLMASEMAEINGKHYLRAVVAQRRSPDAYGRTHTVWVPVTPDPKEVEYGKVADQQEIESLRCQE